MRGAADASLRRCIFYDIDFPVDVANRLDQRPCCTPVVSMDKLEQHIPFVGALLKKEQDVEALLRYDEKGGKYPKNWSDLGPRYNQ
jgi:hypothetical protein